MGSAHILVLGFLGANNPYIPRLWLACIFLFAIMGDFYRYDKCGSSKFHELSISNLSTRNIMVFNFLKGQKKIGYIRSSFLNNFQLVDPIHNQALITEIKQKMAGIESKIITKDLNCTNKDDD